MQPREFVSILAISLASLAFQANAADPGTITRYAIPAKPGVKPGSTHEIAAGPDGNLWFTELATDRVGYIVTGAKP